MTRRGFNQTIVLAVVGVVLLVAAFFSLKGELTLEEVITIAPPATTTASQGNPSAPSQPTGTVKIPPKPASSNTPPKGTTGTGAASPPVTTTAPVSGPSPTPEPPSSLPAPAPAPTPWSPGFQATSRTYPEIPSENQRATLPSCDGKSFSVLPIDMVAVASIASVGSPAEYETFTMKSKGISDKYDFAFPADVYVTNVVQEQGLSSDSEDSTVYFALCKDVIGYVTHVKELSEQVYKFVTDSVCLGKVHTGPNACRIELLTLVGRGSPIGKVGRLEGAFGFGVIDLRKGRGLQNPAQYAHPARMEFAACPFSYFVDATALTAKLRAGDPLCSAN